MTFYFDSENHSDQVLAALQNKNGCDILLIGNDNVSSHSDNLWILSPLVSMGEYSTKKSKSCPDCNLKIQKLP